MKILVLDTETTGLDGRVNSTLSLSGMVIEASFTPKDVYYKVLEEFDIFHKPLEGRRIEPEAMERNGIDLSTLHESAPAAYTKFFGILRKYCSPFDKDDKMVTVGYNVDFDINMISGMDVSLWKKPFSRVGSYISRGESVCVLRMVNHHFLRFNRKNVPIKNRKLETVCEHFGINIDPHKSLSDAKATWELFLKLY